MSTVLIKSGRQTWMDAFRGICIILIILLHSHSALKLFGGNTPEVVSTFNDALEPFRIPSLMFLSGILLSQSLKKNFGEFIYGKNSLVLWPYVVWTPVHLFFMGILSRETLIQSIYKPASVLWYLWFLYVFYMLAFAFKFARINFLILAIILLVASSFLPDAARMSRFVYLLSFFLLGYCFTVYEMKKDFGLFFSWVCVTAVVSGFILSATGFHVRYEALYAWIPLAAIALALRLSEEKSIIPNGMRNSIEFIGRNSIVFFVAHYPIQLIVSRTVAHSVFDQDWTGYLLVVSLSLAGCFLLELARERSDAAAALFDFRKARTIAAHALFEWRNH